RGTKRLFDAANLTLHAGHKVGLIGANGSGKSSLFAALRHELVPDAGAISLPAAWTVAHVAQETPVVDAPAIEYVQDGDPELRTIERALAAAGPTPGGGRTGTSADRGVRWRGGPRRRGGHPRAPPPSTVPRSPSSITATRQLA